MWVVPTWRQGNEMIVSEPVAHLKDGGQEGRRTQVECEGDATSGRFYRCISRYSSEWSEYFAAHASRCALVPSSTQPRTSTGVPPNALKAR